MIQSSKASRLRRNGPPSEAPAPAPRSAEGRDRELVSQRQREDEALKEAEKARLKRVALTASLRQKRLAAEETV
jgi:hypothetical protein